MRCTPRHTVYWHDGEGGGRDLIRANKPATTCWPRLFYTKVDGTILHNRAWSLRGRKKQAAFVTKWHVSFDRVRLSQSISRDSKFRWTSLNDWHFPRHYYRKSENIRSVQDWHIRFIQCFILHKPVYLHLTIFISNLPLFLNIWKSCNILRKYYYFPI